MRALRRLEAHDLVQQGADGTYALAHDAADRLAEIEARLGVDARLERRLNRIREEQRAWRRAMADQRRPVRPTPAIGDATRIDAHKKTEAARSRMMKEPQVSSAAAPRAVAKLGRAPPGHEAITKAGTMFDEPTNTTTGDAAGRATDGEA